MATMEPYSNIFPFNWPISPISDQKINQVKTCEIEGLSITRYPNRISSERLYSLFEPKTSCDWAVLANAYIERVGGDEELPEIAKGAFGKAISDNIGFAFSYPLFYKFFASFLIVEKPPLFEQEINKINISYKWEGIGDPVKYIIDISNANINPEIVVSSYEPITITQNLKTSVDIGILQALGSTFSNLLPIEKQFSLLPCYDNNPDWIVTLTLKDGTMVEVKTNGSNMVYLGSPWQININGQDYLQFSLDFLKGLDAIIRELGLPYGQTMAMYCDMDSVIEKAYP